MVSATFQNAAQASDRIKSLVAQDSAGKFNCGAGVRFTLEALGVPHVPRSESGSQDGYKWAGLLRRPDMVEAGWKEVDWQAEGWTPETSPPGIVWVYPHNTPRGNNGKGAEFGHVEIATGDGYASGGYFKNPGGSVRKNTPVAFVNDKLTEMMGADGVVPENIARGSLQRAQEISPFQRQARKNDEGTSVSLLNTFGSASYDLNTMDLSNMGFGELIGMIMSIFFGLDPNVSFPKQERAEMDVPLSAVTPADPDADTVLIKPAGQ